MRHSTVWAPSVDLPMDREIDGKYENIKIVADKIEDVTTVAEADLTQMSIDIREILDFTDITVVSIPSWQEPTWDAGNKVLSIPDGERGPQGIPGIQGYPGINGEDGAIGPQGVGVDHIAATSTTEPHGDFATAGFTDTYSLYGDVEETILLGFFQVTNGVSGITDFTAIEKAKLAGIEDNATANQTGAEIKSLYEAQADTNVLTDAEKVKLSNTEVSAQLDSRDIANRARGNHTGVQLASTIVEEIDKKFLTEAERAKINNTPTNTAAELAGKLDTTGGTLTGPLVINADIIQNGAAYETHAEQVYTTKDEVILRDGAVGALGVGVYAGIRAKLYDGVNDGLLVFGNDGTARVGDVGSLQALVTREDSPSNGDLLIWNSSNSRMESTRDIDVDNITVSGTVDGRDISADGTKLDGIEANAKDDQSAAEVAFTPTSTLTSTDVQAVISELESDVGTEADFDAAINF